MAQTDPVLGTRYRDPVTGFEGIATSRTRYLHGCDRVCLEALGNDGKPASAHFDLPQLQRCDSGHYRPARPAGDVPG